MNSEDGEDNTTWEYSQLWVKSYPVQTGSLFWSHLEDTLYIGFDDGKIQRLKITDNGLSTEVSSRGFKIFSCPKSADKN